MRTPLTWCILLFGAVYTRLPPEYGAHDAFLVARCEARCCHHNTSCLDACLSEKLSKPGVCPSSPEPFAAVCLRTCGDDDDCPFLEKCCRHSCGVTCQFPEGLSEALGLPATPEDITVKEGPKKRTLTLEWKASSTVPTVYLVEERHHVGQNYVEEHMGDWTLCGRSFTTNYTLKNFARPVRWYQFRVAAINSNGTKGFSEKSPIYNTALRPRPPKAPQNVTVSSLWSDTNGTIFGELHWVPPQSDLPIQRYRIFWSRRLHGVAPLESVLVHQKVISKDETKFYLQNLKPNSLYFLQIQALAQYGKKRLRGQKSGLILNTGNYTTTNSAGGFEENGTVQGIRVQKMVWAQKGLKVRISWRATKGAPKYTVSLWPGPCFGNTKNFKMTVTTLVTHYDFFNLEFNCKYRVGVKSVGGRIKTTEDSFISFVTPTCQAFQKMYRKTKCIK